MNGCKYCYANRNPKKAFKNNKLHYPNSSLLIGNVNSNDIIQQGAQKSFLKKF